MKALIIEDETAAAVNLQAILREIAPDVEALATIETVEESVTWLREREQPDLLFMDIHLADGESFRIFDRVEVNVPVVFTTAYDRYALEAFRVNSIDYLLKPINPADLQRALQKLARLSGGERADYPERVRTMNAARRERVFLVHVRDKIVPLDRDRIAFFYTANERVTACTFQGEEYPLEAGCGFLIEPGQMSFYQADEKDPWMYIWVGFAGKRAEEYVKSMGISPRHPVFHSEQSDELYSIVRDMMDHNTVGVANELRRNGLLHIFLSVVAQSMPEERREETDRANQYVRRAVEFIQRNYCNPIRVTDVADYVCVNRSYLYTLFQKSLGMSPQQFLAAYRLTKAAEMLMVPHLPVESIALSCGYQDPLVFSKAFRQMKGVSPTMYRKQIQQDENRVNREHLKQVEEFISKVGRLELGGEP